MSWLESMKKRFQMGPRNEVPGGIWVKCIDCGDILLRERLIENLWVCDRCDFHFRITPDDYINLLFDKNTFKDINSSVYDVDFLCFINDICEFVIFSITHLLITASGNKNNTRGGLLQHKPVFKSAVFSPIFLAPRISVLLLFATIGIVFLKGGIHSHNWHAPLAMPREKAQSAN